MTDLRVEVAQMIDAWLARWSANTFDAPRLPLADEIIAVVQLRESAPADRNDS